MKYPLASLSALVLGAALSTSSLAAGNDAHWSYKGKTGPQNWHSLHSSFGLCKNGQNQSPVNLTAAKETQLAPLELNYQATGEQVVNNGHTVQVNFVPGSQLTLAGHSYELKQFHVHAPSENQIEGEHFPLEAHFVHADDQGQLAVLALMFKEGQANTELAKAWQALPLASGEKAPLTTRLNAAQLLPASLDYFRFNGSLTTPPCTEGVSWLVLKEAVEVSAAQLSAFTELLPHANNRPVQPLNARIIVQ